MLHGQSPPAVLLTALLHAGGAGWDELALLGLSALIGVALAYLLGSARKG